MKLTTTILLLVAACVSCASSASTNRMCAIGDYSNLRASFINDTLVNVDQKLIIFFGKEKPEESFAFLEEDNAKRQKILSSLRAKYQANKCNGFLFIEELTEYSSGPWFCAMRNRDSLFLYKYSLPNNSAPNLDFIENSKKVSLDSTSPENRLVKSVAARVNDLSESEGYYLERTGGHLPVHILSTYGWNSLTCQEIAIFGLPIDNAKNTKSQENNKRDLMFLKLTLDLGKSVTELMKETLFD